MDKRPICM